MRDSTVSKFEGLWDRLMGASYAEKDATRLQNRVRTLIAETLLPETDANKAWFLANSISVSFFEYAEYGLDNLMQARRRLFAGFQTLGIK